MTTTPHARPPCVSVVIPTFRSLDLLHRCLSAVLAQRLPGRGFEVVVVDGGHDDDTRDFIEALARDVPASIRLRYLCARDGRGPVAARNRGWRMASAGLIAFADDDTVPAADWLIEGERAMRAHPDWAAACGRVEMPERDAATGPARMTQGLAIAESVTANVFVRRFALQAIGGFDERFKRAWRADSDLRFRLAAQVGEVGRIPFAVVRLAVRHASWGVSLRQRCDAFFDALLHEKQQPTRLRGDAGFRRRQRLS
ncbi:MAG TPA: glycosyltransferase [Burkholderiaceae bacterium]|nr:glycosyltransferase [Burkholderiaceae bacterium]